MSKSPEVIAKKLISSMDFNEPEIAKLTPVAEQIAENIAALFESMGHHQFMLWMVANVLVEKTYLPFPDFSDVSYEALGLHNSSTTKCRKDAAIA